MASPTLAPNGIAQVDGPSPTAEKLDISAGLRQQNLALLSLTYRYMAILLWLGLAALWVAIVGLLSMSQWL
jgi:hypothetical protein